MNQVANARKSMERSIKLRPGCSILIIEARFYEDVSDELFEGARKELDFHNVKYTRVAVPGALEIPLVLSAAIAEGMIPRSADHARYCGAVVLGCVIKGETSHYDIVCHNANHWIMEQAIRHSIPLGNGILTVDTKKQAMERAQGGRLGKGAAAVHACLKLIELQREFEEQGA